MGRVILAIDPGPEKSGWVVFDGAPRAFRIEDNTTVLVNRIRQTWLNAYSPYSAAGAPLMVTHLVVEMTESRGKKYIGKSVHETTFWAGRFFEAFAKQEGESKCSRLYRHEVKLQLFGTVVADNAHVRGVLVDRWGGKDKAIGKKGKKRKGGYPDSTVGPLYGIKDHVWQALGLAVAWWELNPQLPDEETRSEPMSGYRGGDPIPARVSND